MPKYVLCPRCELNYMPEGEKYCDVCKAELKLGPSLVFAVDEEEENEQGEKLCPICKRNYIPEDEDMCEQCREDENSKFTEVEPDEIDIGKDEEWRNYLDDDEKDMPPADGEDVISFSQLADEEKGDELFQDDEEDEDDVPVAPPEDDDDFSDIPFDDKDFTEDDEEDEDKDEDEEEDDDD